MWKRANWSGHLAFVLAASASAVGLGNIWRFPSQAASHGGGVFLLAYVIFSVFFGIPLLVTEIALGRKTRRSPSRTFRRLNRKWWFVGALAMIIPVIILPYYSVIGGWVVKYFISSFFSGTAAIEFDSWRNDIMNVGVCMFAFQLLTFALVFLGIKQGIEKSNKIMMPALILLTIAIAVFVVLQPASRAGIRYYMIPDFPRLSSGGASGAAGLARTLLAAMGQMFFSLSIAMGIMITYGSYVRKDDSIPKASARIVFFDTFVALLAGLIIIPGAFAFGGAELAQKGGFQLMFVSLPKIFSSMAFGRIVEIAFFTLVLFAALTSSISIAETVTSSLCDFLLIKRRTGAIIVFLYMFLASIPSALSLKALGAFDFTADILLMPICAFLTCFFVGWVIKPDVVLDEIAESRPHARKLYTIFIRFIAPILIAVIFVSGLLDSFGIISL